VSAPRAPETSVRPRRVSGLVMRPLNFTVRSRMSKGDAAAWLDPTRRLRLLRLVANFTPLVLLALVGVVGIVLHFSPSFIPLGPISGGAIFVTGVALVTASFISSANFHHGVAACPHCGQRFVGTRPFPYQFWIRRRCQHCNYDVVTGKCEGDF